MQFDERDTPAPTPTACPSPSPATTTGTAWTPASPAPRRRAWSQGSPGGARASPSSPQAVNAQQRPAGTRREPAPEDTRQGQHPAEAERMQGQQEAPALPSPGNRERLRPCRASAQPNTRASPTACTKGADDLERERGGERGEEREGAHRKSQHYSAAQHLHPMRPPPRRSTHAASRPSIPGQTASPGERPAPGDSIPLLWSMRNYH